MAAGVVDASVVAPEGVPVHLLVVTMMEGDAAIGAVQFSVFANEVQLQDLRPRIARAFGKVATGLFKSPSGGNLSLFKRIDSVDLVDGMREVSYCVPAATTGAGAGAAEDPNVKEFTERLSSLEKLVERKIGQMESNNMSLTSAANYRAAFQDVLSIAGLDPSDVRLIDLQPRTHRGTAMPPSLVNFIARAGAALIDFIVSDEGALVSSEVELQKWFTWLAEAYPGELVDTHTSGVSHLMGRRPDLTRCHNRVAAGGTAIVFFEAKAPAQALSDKLSCEGQVIGYIIDAFTAFPGRPYMYSALTNGVILEVLLVASGHPMVAIVVDDLLRRNAAQRWSTDNCERGWSFLYSLIFGDAVALGFSLPTFAASRGGSLHVDRALGRGSSADVYSGTLIKGHEPAKDVTLKVFRGPESAFAKVVAREKFILRALADTRAARFVPKYLRGDRTLSGASVIVEEPVCEVLDWTLNGLFVGADARSCLVVLSETHRLGWLHRDIHKSNFLYDRNGNCVILNDWASSRAATEDGLDGPPVTASRRVWAARAAGGAAGQAFRPDAGDDVEALVHTVYLASVPSAAARFNVLSSTPNLNPARFAAAWDAERETHMSRCWASVFAACDTICAGIRITDEPTFTYDGLADALDGVLPRARGASLPGAGDGAGPSM